MDDMTEKKTAEDTKFAEERAGGADRTDIRSLSPDELAKLAGELGQPAYRAGQIFRWLHEKRAASFQEMTDLPAQVREELSARCRLVTLSPAERRISAADGTRKYLFCLEDGNVIESVLMRYRFGASVCVSSQAGCRMGCRFCASAIGGRVRDLTASEMLEQVYRIREDLGERITHVVVMGTGEPLDNYANTVRFLRLLTDGRGQNISQRNLTVSTCGLAPQILRLAEEGLPVTLALSLHAPDDATRRRLMPVASRYPLAEVLDACGAYFEKTGRRVTYEYSLIRGVNDSPRQAEALARLLRDRRGHVNLIPVNPVPERNFAPPSPETAEAFKNHLEKRGIHVTIRRGMGGDIGGACGQLRRSYIGKTGKREK